MDVLWWMEKFEISDGLAVPVGGSSGPVRWNLTRSQKIPRPPNAFMIFANEWRRNIANEFPHLNNKEVSVKLGIMWKSLQRSEKEYYFALARKADVQHKLLYPDYVYNPKEARIRKFLREQYRSSQSKSQRRKQMTRNKSKKSSCVPNARETSFAEEQLLEAYIPVLTARDGVLNLAESETIEECLEYFSPDNENPPEISSDIGLKQKDFSELVQGIIEPDGPRVIVAPVFSDKVTSFKSESLFSSLDVAENEEIVIADLDGPNWYPFNVNTQLVTPSERHPNNISVGSIFGISNGTPLCSESGKSNAALSNGQEPMNVSNIVALDINECMTVNEDVEIGYIVDNDIFSQGEHDILEKYSFPETITSKNSLQTIDSEEKDLGHYLSQCSENHYNEVGKTDNTQDSLKHITHKSPKYFHNIQDNECENLFKNTKCNILADLPMIKTPYIVPNSDKSSFSVNHDVGNTSFVGNLTVSPFKGESMSLEYPTEFWGRTTSANSCDLSSINSLEVTNFVESFTSSDNIKSANTVELSNNIKYMQNIDFLKQNIENPSYQLQYLAKLKSAVAKDVNVFLMDCNESNIEKTEYNSPKLFFESEDNQIASDLEHQSFLKTLSSPVNVFFSRGQPLILRRRNTESKIGDYSQEKTVAEELGNLTGGQPYNSYNSVQKVWSERNCVKKTVNTKTAGEKITYIVNKIVNRDLRSKEVSTHALSFASM